jgi:hypothetical protein
VVAIKKITVASGADSFFLVASVVANKTFFSNDFFRLQVWLQLRLCFAVANGVAT